MAEHNAGPEKNEPLGISRPLTALYWVALRDNLVGVWGSSRRYRNEASQTMIHRPALATTSRRVCSRPEMKDSPMEGPASNSLPWMEEVIGEGDF